MRVIIVLACALVLAPPCRGDDSALTMSWVDLAPRGGLLVANESGPASPAPAELFGGAVRIESGRLVVGDGEPGPLPAALQGGDHVALDAGERAVIVFRDGHRGSPLRGDVVAWVGTADELRASPPGGYRVRLMDDHHAPPVEGITLRRASGGSIVVMASIAAQLGAAVLPHVRRFTLAEADALRPTTAYTIPLIDLADDRRRQTIVDREAGQYLGHPTTVLLEDGRTIITVYPMGHGRGPIIMKRSGDGGLSWSERLPVPATWATSKETPTIHRVVDRAGVRRLIMFSGLHPIRMAVSGDDGATWSELAPIGEAGSRFGGIVAMGCVERVGDGAYMAMFHDDGRFFAPEGKRSPTMTLYQTRSSDGGMTWGAPIEILARSDVHLCEPGIVRSPDGETLAVLLRENRRKRNSFVIFSTDEGLTWSPPRELPAALTGDRHTARYAPDGRLFISFRDTTRDSPTQGDWVAWVGTWGDIVEGREGQYRVRLMDNHHRWDCAYPGVEVLPDGTMVATTYGHWTPGAEPYIVSVRLTLDELDALAAR